jgi:hypothetical protein
VHLTIFGRFHDNFPYFDEHFNNFDFSLSVERHYFRIDVVEIEPTTYPN